MNTRRTRVLFAAGLAVLVAGPVRADEEMEPGRWYTWAEAGLNLTQAAYSDNWRGGENSSLAWSTALNATARKRFHNNLVWSSILKLRFGQQYQQATGSDGTRTWSAPQKSEDKIDLESIGLVSRGWKVDPYVSSRYEAKFLDVSDPAGRSVPINPMTFRESAGVARYLRQNDDETFLVRVGLTGRQSYRRVFVDAVSDAKKGRFSNDVGLEVQGDWRLKIVENKVVWLAKASVYKPFAWSEAKTFDALGADSLVAAGVDPNVSRFSKAMDVTWENEFTTQVSKWISFSLYVELTWDRYDNSVTPKLNAAGDNLANAASVRDAVRNAVQWKQTFAVGLTFHLL